MAHQLSHPDRRLGLRLRPHPPALVALTAAVLALGAQAASVQEPSGLLHPAPGAATATGGKTLERALEVDTSTGQRNLDLLLESRGTGDAAAAAAQRPGELPAKRQASTVPPSQETAAIGTPDGRLPLPLGLQTSEAAGAVDTPATVARREWLGGGAPSQPSGQSGPSAPGSSPDGVDPGPAPRADGDVGPVPEAVREALRFLREQRYWLLGGLVLAAVVAAGLQAYARRP
jgi:hypothetical protein